MSLAIFSAILSGIGAATSAGVAVSNYLSQSQMDEINKLLAQEGQLQGAQGQFLNSYATYADALAQVKNLEGTIRGNKLQLKQTSANISAFNQLQSRLQTQFDYGLASLRSQGKAQISNLLAAYHNSSVKSAARGQSGGSAALIEQMARASVVEYAGEDMKLDANGGLYGYALSDYFLDALATHQETQANKEIQQESWGSYYETLKKNMDNLDMAQQNSEAAKATMRDAYLKMAGFYSEDISSAKQAYSDELEIFNALVGAEEQDYQAILNSWDKLQGLYTAYEDVQLKQDEAMSPFTQEWLLELVGSENVYSSTWGTTGDEYKALEDMMAGDFGNDIRANAAKFAELEEEPAIDPYANFSGTREETINGETTVYEYKNGKIIRTYKKQKHGHGKANANMNTMEVM